LIEPPDLGVSSVSGLDDNVSAVNDIKVSATWQLRDDVEWSFDIESESLVDFSLDWFSLPFINIHDVPLLVDTLMSVPDNDVSVFSINTTVDIEYLSVFVDNVSTVQSEHLPPSSIDSASDSEVAASSIGLDFNCIVLPVVISDGLGDSIEEPLLCLVVLFPSVKLDVVVSVSLGNSLHWKSGSDVEWSVDMESEVAINSLCCWLTNSIDVDNLPSLVLATMSLPDENWLMLFVLST